MLVSGRIAQQKLVVDHLQRSKTFVSEMKRFYETFVKGPTPKEEITNFVDGFFCAVRKGEPKTAVFFGENPVNPW